MTGNFKIGLGLLGLVVIGVGTYLYRQSKLLAAFDYDFKTLTYLGSNNNVADLQAVINFTNKADFDITITGYNLDILVENRVIGRAIMKNTNLVIPAKQSSNIPFLAKADTSLTLTLGVSSLIDYFVDETQSTAAIKGTVGIKTGIVSIDNYPVDISTTTGELLDELKSSSLS